MRLFTVATTSYLHFVHVLFDSVRRVHPELKLTVIVTDCTHDKLIAIADVLGPDVDTLSCADLGFDFVEDMRAYYTPLEFCSAIKVLGSAYILKEEESCLFLDPDMVVYDSLFDSVLDQSGELVVCCHSFSPFPKDGYEPDDLEFCLTGHINGGVLFSRNTASGTPALDWLVEKTKYQWFLAPDLGMYADQQWLSALSYLFRNQMTLVLDRGVNVAYWNLHERPLRRENPEAPVMLGPSEPLRLMHFSGFKIGLSGRLTQHSNRVFDDEVQVILEDLVVDYEKKLIIAHKRLGHLKGNLFFSNLPLNTRLQLAEKRWNVTRLKNSMSLILQLKQNLLNFLKSN
jgi:hypothetical protein